MDANRILNATKNRKNILPVINNTPTNVTTPGNGSAPAIVNPALLAATGSGSKPSTPAMATTRSRLDSRRSIRFAGDDGSNDVNDNNASSDNGSMMTGDGTPMSEKPVSPSAASLMSRNSGIIPFLSRRASTKRALLLRRQSSRMSQLTDASGNVEGNEVKEEVKEGNGLLTEGEVTIGEGEEGGEGIIDKTLGASNDSNTEWLPNVSSTILRKQKPKFRLEALPITEFPKFRIFDYQMKENVVLIQGYATILKLLLQSYSNREYVFKNHLLSEFAEIVLVCPAIPKILEYFIDIFHVLYSEGIGDPLDITWQVSPPNFLY